MSTDPEGLTIRLAINRADADAVLDLIIGLAEFEKLAPPDADAQLRFYEDGFVRQPPRFEAWLAEADGNVIGYALIFETYSSFLCRPTLYLEDLFVSPSVRGNGYGKALLLHCVRLAHQRGCGRMEWTCLDWNTRAQEFYETLGAQRMSDWYLYRLDARDAGNAVVRPS